MTEVNVRETRAFQRRVERYVTGPLHKMVAVTTPKIARVCQDELLELGFKDTTISDAGVELDGKLRDGYLCNLHLRTAARILCCLEPFRAGTKEELYQKIAHLPWELWIDPAHPLQVKTFVERSRVSHEGLVAETFTAAVQRRFRDLALPQPSSYVSGESGVEAEHEVERSLTGPQRIWVHLKHNHCDISLDTTGEHLHRRGYRKFHCGAPLRETLAAAILLKMGWSGESPLVDGMCGSGTFAVEAALMAKGAPPGMGRRFLFEAWPSFQEKTWGHMRKKASESYLPSVSVPITALDMDEEAVRVARSNAERAGVLNRIRFEAGDFFLFDPASLQMRPGLVVLNPPYGMRLPVDSGELYRRTGTHLRKCFQGWRVAVLAPDKGLAGRLGLPAVRYWSVEHGGRNAVVALGSV